MNKVALQFHQGLQVTLVLDLQEEESGTLSASVDDDPTVQLFSGVLSSEPIRNEGFVPALCTVGPGKF